MSNTEEEWTEEGEVWEGEGGEEGGEAMVRT